MSGFAVASSTDRQVLVTPIPIVNGAANVPRGEIVVRWSLRIAKAEPIS
jgi:hypothetical protein